jgi:hypothetical protein
MKMQEAAELKQGNIAPPVPPPPIDGPAPPGLPSL